MADIAVSKETLIERLKEQIEERGEDGRFYGTRRLRFAEVALADSDGCVHLDSADLRWVLDW